MANELLTAKPWELLHTAADLPAPAFMYRNSYTLPTRYLMTLLGISGP